MCTTSGLASSRSWSRLSKERRASNRSASCRAINSSRSQAATSAHSLIRRICSACASAILPHPTMATLRDIAPSFPTALEVATKPFCCRHTRGPSQECFDLRIGVAAALPVRVPRPAIEDGRQLAPGPRGVLLPGGAEQIAGQTRNGDGPERSDVSLIEPQEL